jgi:hypothetical protein
LLPPIVEPGAVVRDDEIVLPNASTSPGSHVPIEPTIVRKIRAETRTVLAIFRVRRPGVQRETQFVSDNIRRSLAAELLFLRGLEQYCVGKVKSINGRV